MTTFASAVTKQSMSGKTRTTNDMKTRNSSKSACVDYFFKVGAYRNQPDNNHIDLFLLAAHVDEDTAVRILLHSRDIREGSGERKHFRLVFQYLAINNIELAKRILQRIPELGRWDDALFGLQTPIQPEVLALISSGIEAKDGLLFKWLPRENSSRRVQASIIRKHLGLTPKQYRKLLVENTIVVESQMCANQWSDINYSHVPSQASRIYGRAFKRQDEVRYTEFLADVLNPDSTTKINAGAIYPYEVIKGGKYGLVDTELNRIRAQWQALPNFIESDSKILPMIDVSGSMACSAGGSTSVTCMDVAVSLGLYIAEKQTGAFKDTYLTFDSNPMLRVATGDVIQKLQQIYQAPWGMSTNLERAMQEILATAIKGKVPTEEMPEYLLIFSDMQFNRCVSGDFTANKMIKQAYKDAGYKLPKVVFWNINSSVGVPAKADKSGVALVSGFSPSLVKDILSDVGNFTPEGVMNRAINKERYNY